MNLFGEEIKEKDKNKRFFLNKGKICSEKVSPKKLKELRDTCDNSKWMAIGRSCFLCNGAHKHLIDMDYLNCFSCGRYFRNGVDITIYDEEELE